MADITLERYSSLHMRGPKLVGQKDRWDSMGVAGVSFNRVDNIARIMVESSDGKHLYELTLCADAVKFLASQVDKGV